MIQLRKIDKYEVTLMKDIFGTYLCRFWIGNTYRDHQDKNKFTAYRQALTKIKNIIPCKTKK